MNRNEPDRILRRGHLSHESFQILTPASPSRVQIEEEDSWEWGTQSVARSNRSNKSPRPSVARSLPLGIPGSLFFPLAVVRADANWLYFNLGVMLLVVFWQNIE